MPVPVEKQDSRRMRAMICSRLSGVSASPQLVQCCTPIFA